MNCGLNTAHVRHHNVGNDEIGLSVCPKQIDGCGPGINRRSIEPGPIAKSWPVYLAMLLIISTTTRRLFAGSATVCSFPDSFCNLI